MAARGVLKPACLEATTAGPGRAPRTAAAKKLTWMTSRWSVGFMKKGGFSTTCARARPLRARSSRRCTA
jgi:hypothetical protein